MITGCDCNYADAGACADSRARSRLPLGPFADWIAEGEAALLPCRCACHEGVDDSPPWSPK